MFLPYLGKNEEQALIRKCGEIIESVSGFKPVGWASPRMTPTVHTARLLAEDGYLWHGDYHDADLPYIVVAGKGKDAKRLVALPHSEYTDNRVMRGSPQDFYDAYKGTFDYLYNQEPQSVLNLTLHTHFGARPPLAAMLHEILKYFQGFDGVWFARHDEMARHVLGIEAGRK